MKKNWILKGISILLAGSMLVSMAACSKGNPQQAANNEEAKKYVYDYEELDLGLQDYENVYTTQMEYVNDKLFIAVNADKNENGMYTSDQFIITMNPDGSERTQIAIPKAEDDVKYPGMDEGFLRDAVADLAVPETEEVETEDAEVEKAVTTDIDVMPMPMPEEPGMGENPISVNRYYDRFMPGVTPDTLLAIENINTNDFTNPEMPVYTSEVNLVCLNYNLEEVWKTSLTPYIAEDEYFYVRYFLRDSQGNICLSSDAKCMLFDKDGNYIKNIEMPNDYSDSAYLDENDIFWVSAWNETSTNKILSGVDLKTGNVTETIELPSTLSGYEMRGTGLGYDLVMVNGRGVCGYNKNDVDATQIMSFLNSDLNATYFEQFVALDDGKFIASYWDQGDNKQKISIFTAVAPEDVPDKQAIVLACDYLDWEVKNRIVEFNKSSKEYRVIVKEYYIYNTSEDWMAGVKQLNNDILAGNVPDILITRMDMPVDSYINKGLFADLYAFIEKDEELNKEDYLQNIFEAYSKNGKLYQLVPSFTISTCVAKEKWVGDKDVWTMAEMQEVLAKMPEGATAFGSTISRNGMLTTAMMYNGSKYVDLKKGKCNFDSQEFKDLLNYIATLPTDEEMEQIWSEWNGMNWDTQWREDRTLLNTDGIYSFRDFHRSMQAYIGDDYTIIGFPSAPEKGSVISPNLSFSMSSKSSCKDGAWEFLRYYLTDEYQDTVQWGLPIKESVLEERAMEATQKPTYEDENGNQVEYDDTFWVGGTSIPVEPMTEAEAQELIDYIKSVDRTYNYDTEINNIITEEAAPFFEGQKSVDEVATIIQSRIQIYVDENR